MALYKDFLEKNCAILTELPEIGVDEPFSSPSPSPRRGKGLFGKFELSSDIRPLGSGHGSGSPLAQK